jgi:predicted ribonucleotide reductase-associated flavodoxin
MRILIAYASLSGNTRDLARSVRARCEALGHAVTWIETDIQGLAEAGDNPRHDLYLLGAWTDNAGRTPPEMKRFIAGLVEAVGKPQRLAVFGTGETQWGEEYYCGALRRMADFFATRYPRLEIEEMPHGERDALAIERWTDQVIAIASDQRSGGSADAQHDTDTDTTIPHADTRRLLA